MEKYFVVENRDIRLNGKTEFVETVMFSGTREECASYENMKRKEYKDRSVVDCFTQSESERNQIKSANEFWNTLTKKEKEESIMVDGKKYNKALYDFYKKQK